MMPLWEAFHSPAETAYSYWEKAGVYLIILKGSIYLFIVLEKGSYCLPDWDDKTQESLEHPASISTNNW